MSATDHIQKTQPALLTRIAAVLCVLGGVAGGFGPWVAHKAAALVVTGVDLAEFVKFLPEVRAGTFTLTRELYYLPLFCGSILLVLIASDRGLAYPWPIRWLLVALSVPVALSMLPPAWTPHLMRAPEFRVQALAILVCLLLALCHTLLRRLKPWPLRLAGIVLALLAAVIPLWQFLRVRPLIASVYNKPVALGWGPYITVVAFALTAILVATLRWLVPEER